LQINALGWSTLREGASMRSIRVLVASAAALLLGAGPALAGGISSGVDYVLSVGIGGNTYTLDDLDTSYLSLPGIGGTWTLDAPAVTPYGTVDSWSSHYEYDPQVSNNFSVTNTTLVAQIFTVSVTSPIAPVLPTSLMRGSIGITLTDQGPLVGDETDGSASLDSALGQAVYRAFIDGNPIPAQSLFLDPYTLSCGSANCSNSQNTDFGIPVRIAGPGGSLSMGITVQFLLSPGDSASVTSTFNIIPVPEPSTVLTLGLGIVALTIARRRSA
jgi:hypothetical protein